MVQNTKRYTVITGASSGIGYETTKAFAERESNLILIARSGSVAAGNFDVISDA